MSPADSHPLSDFAPLIQLWAGICAICFYDNLVNGIFANQKRKKISLKLSGIRNQMGDMFDEKTYQLLTIKIDQNLYWFRRRVSHIGRLSCGLAVVMLVLMGFENEWATDSMYIFLFCSSVAYLVYCVVVIEVKSLLYIKHPWAFLIPMIIIVLILTIGLVPNCTCDILTSRQLVALCIVMMALPLPYFVIKYYMEKRMLTIRLSELNEIKDNFRIIGRMESMGIKTQYIEMFSHSLQWELKGITDKNKIRKVFNEYVMRRLQSLFHYGNPWIYNLWGKPQE